MKTRLLIGIWAIILGVSEPVKAQQWTQVGYLVVNGDTVRGSQTRCLKGFNNDVFACTESGLFKSTDNGNSWTNITFGKAAVQNEKMVSILVAGNGNMFLGSDNNLFKSTDGGNSWSRLASLPDSLKYWDLAEINGNIVAAYTKGSSGGVYYSGNYGSTWTAASGISTPVRYLLVDGSNLFLGGNANGVYKSTDNGQSWTTGTGFPPSAGIWNVEKQGGKLFASSVAGKGLFSSSDNGASWDSAAVSYFTGSFCQIFGMKANSSAIVVANDGTVAVGCDVAFRISTDNGNTWSAFETGISTANPAFYFPNLGMSADGSSMFTIRNNGNDVYRFGSSSAIADNSSSSGLPISIYPNPAKESINIENLPGSSRLTITDITGKKVYQSVVQKGKTMVSTADFEPGIYLVQVDNNGTVTTRKLVIHR